MFKNGVILKETVSFHIHGTLKRQHSDSGIPRIAVRGGVCPSAAIFQCFYKTRTERPLTLIAGALRTSLSPHWLGRTHMRHGGKGGEGTWAAPAPSA